MVVLYEELEDAITKNDTKMILYQLRKFGKAPDGFDFDVFLTGLAHKNPVIRGLCVKHLGKFPNQDIVKRLVSLFKTETDRKSVV